MRLFAVAMAAARAAWKSWERTWSDSFDSSGFCSISSAP